MVSVYNRVDQVKPGSTDEVDIDGVIHKDSDLRAKILKAQLDPGGSSPVSVSASNPSYSFVGDEDTGFYRSASNQISLSVGGTESTRFLANQNIEFLGTGALTVHKGTNAQQPGSPVGGMLRYNTDTNSFELYDENQWIILNSTNNNNTYVIRSGDTMTGTLTFSSGVIKATDGSQGSPSYSFQAQDNMGIYRNASNDLRVTVGGSDQITVSDTDTVILGNLTVQGTTTTFNSDNTTIDDNIIILNDGESGSGVTLGSSGLEVDRGSSTNVQWVYDESNSAWQPNNVNKLDNLNLISSQSTGITFEGSNQTVFSTQTSGSGSDVNYLEAQSNQSSSSPLLKAQGSDANINVGIQAKGTGVIWTNTSLGINTQSPNASLHVNGTDAVQLPSGTTGERPSSPINGMIRYNTTDNQFESYSNGTWVQVGGTREDLVGNTNSTLIVDGIENSNAVNYLEIENSSTSNPVKLNSAGADSDINVEFNSKGSGSFQFNSPVGINVLPIVGLEINTTDAILLPKGTDSERPGSPSLGMLRYNTDQNRFEGYSNGSWSSLAGSSEDLIGSSNSTIIVDGIEVPSAVNYIEAINASTGNEVSLEAAGTDTDVDLKLAAKGTGILHFTSDIGFYTTNPSVSVDLNTTDGIKVPSGTDGERPGSPPNGVIRYNTTSNEFEGYKNGSWQAIGGSGNGEDLVASSTSNLILDGLDTSSAVNYLTVQNSSTGNPVEISLDGGDTNIPLHIGSKGASNVVLNSTTEMDTGTQLLVQSGTQGSPGFGFVQDTSAGIYFNNNEIRFVDNNTDLISIKNPSTLDAVLTLEGTSAVRIPAGTQAERPSSPTNGMIRLNNDTTPNNSVEFYDGESGSWLSLTTSAGSGETNNGSNIGTGVGIFAQKSGTTLEFKSLISGPGITVQTSGTDEVEILQTGKSVFTGQTTDATTTTIGSVSLASGEVKGVRFKGYGQDANTGDVYGLDAWILVKNVGGTTSKVGSTSGSSAYDSAASSWLIEAVANNTSDALDIRVTGESTKTIDWQVTVEAE